MHMRVLVHVYAVMQYVETRGQGWVSALIALHLFLSECGAHQPRLLEGSRDLLSLLHWCWDHAWLLTCVLEV